MAYVVLDLETTGLDSQKDTIIEVGALRFAEPRALQHTGPCAELQLLVNPGRTLDPAITDLTGIQDSDLAGQAPWEEVRPRVQAFLSAPATYFVAHNVEFERSFLEQHNVDLSRLTLLDTYDLAFMALPQVFQLNLRSLCIRVGIDPGRSHRAYADALATARVFALLLRQVESLPDEFLQQLLAHSPCEDWGFRDVWSAIAAQRNLAELGRNKPMVWPLPVDSGNPGHPDASPAPGSRLENAQENLLSLAQPSLYQALEVEQRNADPTFPCKGAESMAQVLAAGNSQVLLVNPDKGRREAVALAAHQWAVAHDRRALLCLPHCENDRGQDTVVQALAQAAGDRASFVPDPGRCLDWERLNVWKAGRTLDPGETRLLGKILHWASSTPTAVPERLFLRHDLDHLVIWPQLACQPSQFTVPDPDPPQTLPAATHGPDSLVTVMDHGALLQALQKDPGFAGEFDAIIVDDIWHLIQNLPQFTTTTHSLQQATYFLGQLQPIAAQSPHHDAAQWLGTLAGMAEKLSDLSASRERADAALQDFTQQVDAFSQSEMEQSDTRLAYAVAKPVHELRDIPLFNVLVDTWHSLARSLRDLLAAGHALLDAIPSFDAEEAPVQGRYVCQLQGWLEGLDAFGQGVDQVLHPSGLTAEERQEFVHWVEMRQQATACQFNITRYCGEAFWQERALSQCDQVLFLHVSSGTPRKGGYLTQRLGITHLPQARLASAPAKARAMLVLNPRDLPAPTTNDFKRTLEALLPALAASITGNAVFILGHNGQRQAVAAVLRHRLQGKPIHILEDELEPTETVLEALADPQPTIFCCTARALQSLHWEGIDVQCVLMERLPFTQFQDPLLDHQSRYAPRELNRFHDQTLPICVYNLMRASDLLNGPPDRPTALVLLDSRLITRRYGERLRKALPSGRWKHPVVEDLPGALQAWLAQA